MYDLTLKLNEYLPDFLIDCYLGLCPAEAVIWGLVLCLVWRI